MTSFVPMKTDLADVQQKAALKKELQSNKISLGNEKTSYDTTYLVEHNDKGYCKDTSVSHQIMKDLRKTHYQLGYQNVGSM
jgi:hypothetical protein